MTRFILYAILVLVLIRALSRLMRGVLEGAGYQRRSQPAAPSVNLVRDPICGMFVVPSKALTSGSGASTRYFCSERCRQQWMDDGKGNG